MGLSGCFKFVMLGKAKEIHTSYQIAIALLGIGTYIHKHDTIQMRTEPSLLDLMHEVLQEET